jgi:hypothetical protein
MSYFLPDRYVARTDAIQDFEGEAQRKDDVQREVYEESAKLARELDLVTVIDLGTGSGWKLIKHFGKHSDGHIVGVDLPPAVAILRKRYPKACWVTPDNLPYPEEMRKAGGTDLLICSDMIEHVEDPDATCETIKSLNPKWIVMSTPDRDLVDRCFHPTNKTFGPPRNRCHVREWNFEEFDKYMASHFDVVRHFWSNEKQCTQAVIARLKSEGNYIDDSLLRRFAY